MAKTEWFGTDGVRGRVGDFPMLPDFVLRLGLAIGVVLRQSNPRPSLVIGRDTRYSGQMLQSALTSGLLAGGATVIDAGVITTPGVAYLVRKLGMQAGVVISASHNPVDQNGIKLFDDQGFKLPETTELEIEALVRAPDLLTSRLARPCGRCLDGHGLQELYVESLVGEHPDLKLDPLSLVMDCAHGAAYQLGPECFNRMGARVIAVNASPTGLNINAAAGSEHVRQQPSSLSDLVRHHKANFGLAFDGDADRVIFVDEAGRLVDGDHMLGILASHLEQRGQLVGRTIVATSMRNVGLINFVKASQFNFVETKVGDKYVVEKLLELIGRNAPDKALALGGEQSGHIILLDKHHSTGDGIRTALYVTRALLESGSNSLAQLATCVQKTPQIIASAHVTGKPPLENIPDLKRLEDEIKQNLPGLQRKELRYSGTEPLFRAMLESDERHSAAELADSARAICQAVQQAAGASGAPIEILNCSQGGTL